MNNLKQYAGLLNDEAPENHFLAYITPSERDMLVEAGGVKTSTPSGIFAYPPGYGGSGYQGGNNASDNATGGQGGSSGTGTDGQGSTGGGGDTPSPGDTGGEGGSNPQDNSTTQFNNSFNDNDDIDSTYTNTSFDVTPEPVEKSVGDKIMDFVMGGGVTGAILRSIGGKLGIAKENKYAGITGEDGYGEGDYISTQGDWAASKGFVDKAEDYYDLDLEEQQDIDKQMYDDGVRSQAFNDLYDGDTSNINNLTSTERDAVNSIIPNMSYEVGNTTPQKSMVNDYFANLNNTNLGISENYLNTYNTAKSKMANTLNITPNTQQYGYGNSYNDTYSRSMNNTNVFYNYLNEQGLI